MTAAHPARVALTRALRWSLLSVPALYVLAAVGIGTTHDVLSFVRSDLGWLIGGVALLVQPAPVRERVAWRLFGAGALLVLVGDLVYVTGPLRAVLESGFSVADAVWGAGYLAWVVAVALLVRGQMGRMPLRMWCDALVTALGCSALAAAVLVDRLVAATGGTPEKVAANLAYPTLDLLMIAMLLAGRAMGAARRLLPVGVALGLVGLADVGWLLVDSAGLYADGQALDLAYWVGLTALVLAPDLPRRLTPRERPVRPRRKAGLVRTDAVAAAAVVVALGLVVVDQLLELSWLVLLLTDACLLVAAVRVVLTVRDVRHADGVELELQAELARTDELTGLANRRELLSRCRAEVVGADVDRPVSVVLLDLDRFKEVNDSLGHAAGDELLRQVGARLQQQVRPTDLVARLGGDEFALVMPGASADVAVDRARTLLSVLADPFAVAGERLHVAASAGVSSAPDPAFTAEDLLRLADVAMYDAKRSRRGVALASAQGAEAGAERLRTVDQLVGALAGQDPERNGVLLVHLQPQVELVPVLDGGDATSGRVCGVEALVRWEHPLRGLVPPGDFLPLAQSAGLLGDLARVVLDRALAACRTWWSLGHRVPVAVNLAPEDLQAPGVAALLAAMLEVHGLPGEALVVEVTEDSLMSDPERVGRTLARVRATGIGVSIDDYGTGYSSLAYLRTLPADEVKLDRVFVAGLLGGDGAGTPDPVAGAIVRSTAELVHSMGMRLVAEGVEDAAAAAALVGLGCDVAQGWHVARPMPAVDLLRWLALRAEPADVTGTDDATGAAADAAAAAAVLAHAEPRPV